MNISVEALQAPKKDSLDAWLNTPRLAKCGEVFTPTHPMWKPDKSANHSVNWEAAIACVSPDWQPWLHAALAYRMAYLASDTVANAASGLSRAAKARLNPLKEDHVIDLRERFNSAEFSVIACFMEFWHDCESLERRPSQDLIDAYKELPRKKKSSKDVILSLDPEKGPLTRLEQDSLHQWIHEMFCHGELDPEHYLFLRTLMIYGQRGGQVRMMVFGDFIKTDQGCKVKIHWAKQKGDEAGWRAKHEIFSLDEDLYNTVQAYKAIVLAQLWQTYPDGVDWNVAIQNVPIFRRKLDHDAVETQDRFNPPALLDNPLQKRLEDAPDSIFHVGSPTTRAWLERIERMDGFPISPRTHQPLKVTRGHRFRHTLGTDLSNAGQDEWTIARALMHSNTQTVRKYRKVSAELLALIDAKMSDHLALVVNAFTGIIVTDRTSAKNGDRAERQIEDLAICGATAACHLDAPYTCYACGKFQPLLDADHRTVLERLERRREQTIGTDKTTGVLWDRAILACRKVILDCEALLRSGMKDE